MNQSEHPKVFGLQTHPPTHSQSHVWRQARCLKIMSQQCKQSLTENVANMKMSVVSTLFGCQKAS